MMNRLRKDLQHRQEESIFPIENGIESNSNSRQRIKTTSAQNSTDTAEESVFSVEEEYGEVAGLTGLSLLEELMFLSLGSETSSHLFTLSDNLPNVLRCCILLELALRKRIGVNVVSDSPLQSPLVITNPAPTGDQFLDESLKIIQKHPSGTFSLQKWIELLTGEVWDRKLANCQVFQLRERLCKSLLEKRLVGAEVHRSLLIVERVNYPIKDVQLHRSLSYALIDTATGKIPLQPHNLLLLLAVKAGSLLSSILAVTDADTGSSVRSGVKAFLERYQNLKRLQSITASLSNPQLYLIQGVIEYFSKINDLF